NYPPNTDGVVSLQDDGVVGNGLSQFQGSAQTTFADPTRSLTINSFPGTLTTYSINALPDFDASLTINGNLGVLAGDEVDINGALTLGHAGGNVGSLAITAQYIVVSGTVN